MSVDGDGKGWKRCMIIGGCILRDEGTRRFCILLVRSIIVKCAIDKGA